jgi:hypothetical protein
MKLSTLLAPKTLLTFLGVLLFLPLGWAQNVNFQVVVTRLERSGYGDCTLCGSPDPTWKVAIVDNANGTQDGYFCWAFGSMSGTLWDVSDYTIRSQGNSSASNFTLRFDGFEDNCNSDVCNYNPYNFWDCTPSVFGDSRRCNPPDLTTVNFRTTAPCTWTTAWSPWCGDYRFEYSYYWSYATAPTIATQPTPANTSLCRGTTPPTYSVTATNDANGWNMRRNVQWQISTNTSCASPGTWTNISGATGASYTPTEIGGTRLYRALVTSNCAADFTSNTTASNCVALTYNPMGGGGIHDNPPAVVSSICGATVLPGSTHTVSALLPPSVGAVANLTSYNWTGSAGVTFASPTAATTTVTVPTTAGTYSIAVTYIDGCAAADVGSPICTFIVGSPSCNYIYVSPSGTNVVTAGGPDVPYQTLSYALSQTSGTRHIRMLAGSYTETSIIDIPSNIVIEGGFELSGGTWRKSTSSGTTINCSGQTDVSSSVGHVMGFRANGTSNWTLQDLMVYTADASGQTTSGRGRSNYGLWVLSATGYVIDRCTFVAGTGSDGSSGVTGGAANGGVGGGGGAGGAGRNGRGTSGGGGTGFNPNTGTTTPANGGGGGSNNSLCGGSANGGAGGGGQTGNNGTAGAVGPFGTYAGGYFNPGGNGSSGSGGNGGQGGGGGGGSVGGRCACIDCNGRDGGTGGTGGPGGAGGTGGWGGGGSFGVYITGTAPTAISKLQAQADLAGNGGAGGAGAAGSGGAGGGGAQCNGSCVCTGRCSGAGGSGGSGGTGGAGGNGQQGPALDYVLNGVSTAPTVYYAASSQFNNQHAARYATLFSQHDPGWSAGSATTGDYFYLYFGTATTVYNIATQGRFGCCDQWVTAYTAQYWNGASWVTITGFVGNSDRNTVVVNSFTPVTTTAIRLQVNGFFGYPSMRVGYNYTPITAEYASGKPCRNSEIRLTRPSAGTWSFSPSLNYVSLGTGGTTYSATNNDVLVYTTSASTSYDVTNNSITYNRLLQVKADARTVPVITPSPSIICLDGSVSLSATTWGTETQYDWIVYTTSVASPVRSSSVANPSIDMTGLAAGTYNVRYRVRESCCGWSIPAYSSFDIVAQPTVPTSLPISPNVASLCAGQTLSLSSAATGSTGGTGTCVYEYRFRNPGVAWSTWSTTLPSFTSAGSGLAEVEARRNCDGSNCQVSPSLTASWTIVPDPSAGSPVRVTPAVDTICVGATLTVTASGGTNGTGTITDELQYRVGTTGGWTAYTGPFTPTATGVYYFQTRRTATGNDCNTSTWEPSGNGEFMWFVSPQPVAQTIVQSPNTANVCDSSTVSATFTGASEIGQTDEYRYRTYSGGSWSSYSTYTPGDNISTDGLTAVSVESRRVDTRFNCTNSSWSASTWNINPKPAPAGPISGYTPVCNNVGSIPFSLSTVSGANNYNWTIIGGAGATVASGQGTESVLLNFNGATPGAYMVRCTPQYIGTITCSSTYADFNVTVVDNTLIDSLVSDAAVAGNWSDPTKWAQPSTGARCLPTCGINTAILPSHGITVDATGSCKSLTLRGNLSIPGTTLNVCSGDLTRLSTGTLSASTSANVNLTGDGTQQNILGDFSGTNAFGTLQILTKNVTGNDAVANGNLSVQSDLLVGTAGTQTDVSITGTADVARNLTVLGGGSFAVGNILSFSGANAGVLSWGTSPQSNVAQLKVTLNKTGLTPTLTLGSTLTLDGASSIDLTLTSGRIVTGANQVILNKFSTLTHTGGWIEGTLQRNVWDAGVMQTGIPIDFPVGDANQKQLLTAKWTTATDYPFITAAFVPSPSNYPGDISTLMSNAFCGQPAFTIQGNVWDISGTGAGTTAGAYDLTLYPVPPNSGGPRYTVVTRANSAAAWSYAGTCDMASTSSQVQSFGLTSFSEKMDAGSGIPLPVELLDFTAKPQENSIELVWNTASERHNAGFVVERGLNTNTFGQISWVKSKSGGQPSGGFRYEMVDRNVVRNQMYYYRLKQTDIDGSTALSNVVEAFIGGAGELSFVLYPNPSRDKINISLDNTTNAKDLLLSLTNALGQTVLERSYGLETGKQQVVLDMQGLADGNYNLTIQLDGRLYNFRVAKVN